MAEFHAGASMSGFADRVEIEKNRRTVIQKIFANCPGREAKAELFLATDETQIEHGFNFLKPVRVEIFVDKIFLAYPVG
jgi:hypothetical protein